MNKRMYDENKLKKGKKDVNARMCVSGTMNSGFLLSNHLMKSALHIQKVPSSAFSGGSGIGSK